MSSLKRIFGNFVLKSDLLSHNVSLRHSGNSDFESYCTGFVSILAFLAFFVIFVLKFLSVIQLQSITAFEHLTDNLESSQPIQDIMFAVTIDGLGMTTIDKYFDFKVTQVTVSRPTGTTVPKTITSRTINILPCKIGYWQNMKIPNMDTIFSKRRMSAYYCPTEPFKIQGTSDEDNYVYAQIKLSQCSSTNPLCENNVALRDAFYQNYVTTNQYFTVKLLMKDSIISPTAQSPVTNMIQKDILITFSTTTGTLGYIQIADYEISTDTNILPWSQYEISQGYYVYRYQTTTVPTTTKFMHLKMQKSTRKFSVEREYGKIDDMLSYVGGLFGLLFYCIQFIMGSYNQYRYELSIGQSLFQYDDKGNQTKADQMGFCTYLTYSIYDWFNFFGIQLQKWTSMKQIHVTRQETNQQMDVRHLMHKIRYLENVVEVLISDEQRIGLLLSNLPTLNKIQTVRKLLEFYNRQEHPQNSNQQVIAQKKLGSQVQLNSKMNYSNFFINQVANQEYARKKYRDQVIKQTIENQQINKTEKNDQDQLANYVSEALMKLMTNQQDPINKKILQKLKPNLRTKVSRSKTLAQGTINQAAFLQIKKGQGMRRSSQ